MFNSKQRLLALLRGQGQIPDRIGRVEAPWPETRARWHKEGLPAGVHANDYFGMDIRYNLKFDASFGLPTAVLEDAADYQVVRTSDATVTKCWKHTGIPHTLSYGIACAADWRRLRGRLTPTVERFAFGYYGDYGYEYTNPPFTAVKKAFDSAPHRATTFLALMMPEPIEGFLSKLGDEMLLMFMATEPELITEMFTAYTDFAIGMIDLAIANGLAVDAAFVGGDIAYKNGLLFSPAMYRGLLMPHHKRLFAHCHAHGLPVIYHTDGDCRQAIPLLIESGIDCLHPLEVRAGMDVRELAPIYGDKIAFLGNISVENLARGGQPMRDEIIAKVSFMAKNRYRYIYHSDHSLPGEVSFANFSEAMSLLDQYGNY